MPSLGELECQIEEASTGNKFEEYGTVYGDGVVETYIVIPSSTQNFSVRLRSKGYISDGLAALVFMDGEYQCNRNRLNLKPPKKGLPRSATEINFRMRQKEKPVGDGSFIGREWRFDTHNQVPDVPQDAHSGHFDNLGTIEILVLRCSSNYDTGSTSSSGLDVDPLSHSEIEDSASDVEDTTKEQNTYSSYVEPAVIEEQNKGSFLGGIGLFDGANDRPDQPNFGGRGHWAYHPYPQGPNMYNENQQWGAQPGFHPGHPPAGFPPQARPPPTGPGKRVHFDMGGPPNTRAGPLPQHLPIPTPAMDASSHGADQQSGYPMYGDPVPFDAMPPFPGPQMAGYGGGPGWGGQGYRQYPMDPGYVYGYGVGPGFGYPYPGFYQGQGYGLSQGGPVYGPAANQSGNMNENTGDPAKDENNPGDGWGDNINTGGDGASGSKDCGGNTPGGGDSWGKGAGENDTSGGATGDWGNNDTGNDTTNAGDNDKTWGEDDNNNDTNGDAANDSSNTVQMGEIYTAQNSQQDNSWKQQDSGKQEWTGNIDSSNQPQNQAQGNDPWNLKQENPYNSTPYQAGPSSSPMPGTFPQSYAHALPRTLYGPHGPYYLPHPPATAPTASPTVEEEPRYDVPQSHINLTHSTHQIVPDRGYMYSHRLHTPTYRDSISSPYARFVFQYRNPAQLAAEIGISVDGANPSEEEVAELASKSKEDIIAMLLRAKAALGGKIPGMRNEDEDDEGRGKKNIEIKPVVVPAPARRLKEYKIPVRAASRNRASMQKSAQSGLSNSNGNPSQQQSFGNGSGNGNGIGNNHWQNNSCSYGNDNANAPQNHNANINTNTNAPGNSTWDTSNQTPQDQKPSWSSENKGDAGARPESSAGGSPTPQYQYQDNNAGGGGQDWSGGAAGSGGGGGGGAAPAPGSGW